MPFSNVSSLTLLVPEQDYFYWPCISGEKYPPTLVTTTYSNKDGYSVLFLKPGGAVTPATVTYPYLPAWKYSSNSFNGYTVTFRINMQNSASGIVFSLVGGTAITDPYTFGFTAATALTYCDSSLVTHTAQSPFGPGEFSVATWYTFSILVTAAGIVSVAINGVTVTWDTPITDTGLSANALRILAKTYSTNGATTPGAYFTQLQVTYS